MRRLPQGLIPLNIRRILLVLAGWLIAGLAMAFQVEDLYQAEVEAAGRTPAHQRAAMAAALKEVAIKVSGRTDLKENQLAPLLKNAEQHVQSYAFEGGARGVPLRMRVAFDSVAVNGELRNAGVPVWNSNRPKVLLWLVREDNGQRRMASPELDAELLEQVKTLGGKRGLPFDLPLNDVQDMQAVSAADVWAGFLDNVRLASTRYHPDIIVLAKVYKAGLLWQGDWQIVAVGGTHSQDFTGPDIASVIEPGIGWVTQDIASVYASATPASEGMSTGAPLTFRITGVHTLQDYAAVQAYLKKLVVIKSLATQETAADALTLAVASDAQVETVLQTLKADGRLVEITKAIAASPEPAAPETVPPTPSTSAPVVPAVTPVYEFEWHG